MKKSLSHRRKRISAAAAGLLLAFVSALGSAQEEAPATRPTLLQVLNKDQIEETVEVFLGLTEQPAGKIHVDYLRESAEMLLPEVHKPQKYELRGDARMKPGRRVQVEGQGVLVAQNYLTEVMDRPTAVGGFLTVWQGIMRDISRADPDSLPAYRIGWQIPGPSGNEEFAAAEKRLGTSLPAIYRETMRRSGPWRVSLPDGFSFELLAPSQLLSVSDWLQRHYGPEEWDGPENQDRRQQFKQDIVFAIVNNEPWVLRRSGTPCLDEQPSFAVGQTTSDTFYVPSVNACGAGEQLETIRQQMLEALYSAFPAPAFAVVNDTQKLRVERDRQRSEKKTLRLFLKTEK